jgi:hypothetical protein
VRLNEAEPSREQRSLAEKKADAGERRSSVEEEANMGRAISLAG